MVHHHIIVYFRVHRACSHLRVSSCRPVGFQPNTFGNHNNFVNINEIGILNYQ